MPDAHPPILEHENITMKVTVKNPEGIVFDGQVFALTSVNTSGPFDILPFHSNLVSLISKKLILYIQKENPQQMDIENGVLKVTENVVEIFLGVETVT